MKIARPDHDQLQQDEHRRHDFGVVEGDVAVELLAEEVLEEKQHEEHEEAPERPHERRLVRALEQTEEYILTAYRVSHLVAKLGCVD